LRIFESRESHLGAIKNRINAIVIVWVTDPEEFKVVLIDGLHSKLLNHLMGRLMPVPRFHLWPTFELGTSKLNFDASLLDKLGPRQLGAFFAICSAFSLLSFKGPINCDLAQGKASA
ncbi:hypothetical protein AMTR_s00025p00141600, partial [Amborella trichopoda]